MMTFTLLGMLFAAVMLLTATLGLCALQRPPRASAAPQAPGATAPRHLWFPFIHSF
jgi:hypothetical protein